MVHTFSCLGCLFAVDTESGSVFETDGLMKKLINEKNSPGSVSAGEFLCYSEVEIAEAKRELDALVRECVLFSAAPKMSVPPEFNGIVKSICLNISHKCNLACAYCFAEGGGYGDKDSSHMPLETAKAAIDFLIKHSNGTHNLEVDFFGGEPLLNFDVVKNTVLYASSLEKKHNKNFRFTLTTNALLLNDDVTDFLNAQMHNVVISIDGREKVHNSMRKTGGGADSFKLALDNSLRFKQKREELQYYVRGTFTAKNLDFASDVFALHDYGFDKLSLEPVVLPDKHPLAIKENHLESLCAEYERLAEEYLRRRSKGDWLTFFHFNLDVYNGPCEAKRVKSCGAGCEYVAVTPDGNIYPCHQFAGMPAYEIGNVNKKRYDKTVPLLFGRQNHVRAKMECEACWAKYYCSGGCAASSVKFEGKLLKPHKISCELMKKRIECALAIYAIENT